MRYKKRGEKPRPEGSKKKADTKSQGKYSCASGKAKGKGNQKSQRNPSFKRVFCRWKDEIPEDILSLRYC